MLKAFEADNVNRRAPADMSAAVISDDGVKITVSGGNIARAHLMTALV